MDFFLPIAAAVAITWTAWFLLRGSLVAACLIAIIGGTLFGFVFWHADLGPVPVTIDRLLVALAAGMYLVHRKLGWADSKPLARDGYVLLAFIGVLLVSTFTHDWRYHNAQPIFKLVQYFLIPAVVYWVVRNARLDERRVLWIFAALTGLGLFVSLTALAEVTGQHWALFPRYLANSKLEYFGRARGPLMNPAGNGILITLCLAAALTWWPRLNRPGQLLLLGFTALATAALYATLTRSAWIGGALGLAVFVGLSVPRQWRATLVSVGLIACLALVAAKWDSIWNLKRDVNLDASASADSAALRPILAKLAWNMFEKHPLAGCGFGQYDREKLPYLADRTGELPLEKVRPYVQHNAFLGLLTETGLIGAGLFALLLALWTSAAWKLWRDVASPLWMRQVGLVFLALFAAYFVNANFHDTNLMDMLNVLVFFMGGLVSGVSYLSKSDPQPCATQAHGLQSVGLGLSAATR